MLCKDAYSNRFYCVSRYILDSSCTIGRMGRVRIPVCSIKASWLVKGTNSNLTFDGLAGGLKLLSLRLKVPCMMLILNFRRDYNVRFS